MEIKKFCLNNIGRFEKIDIPLAPNQHNTGNVTVIVGNNGAGKTSLLKSLATSLSWLVSRIRSENGSGSPIPELVIQNGKTSAAIDIDVFDEQGQAANPDADEADYLFHWVIAKTRKGRIGEHKTNLSDVTQLAEHYRYLLSNNQKTSLPLIAFYPVERAVVEIPLKIKNRHTFLQLDGYDNSLTQGVDFRRFFEWFREREDSENELGISEEVFEQFKSMFKGNDEVIRKLVATRASSKDQQLTAVRKAISQFMLGFSNLRVRRKPRLHMSIDKEGSPLNVAQLSQGEKSLMVLVGDIARRLAMMNPDLENPLMGDGIILIDEVDIHLHPKWQRSLLKQFTSTFPNCQFVLTTHSPLVISDSEDVLAYLIDGSESTTKELTVLPSQFGQDANSVLLDVMDTGIRNSSINIQFNDLFDAIQEAKIEEAKGMLNKLESTLPANNLELAKAKLLLRKQVLRKQLLRKQALRKQELRREKD